MKNAAQNIISTSKIEQSHDLDARIKLKPKFIIAMLIKEIPVFERGPRAAFHGRVVGT